LLRQTNLWAVRNKSVAGFSGGMRQRYGIAQALIGQPRLLIVDEPTAGLDPEERNRFLNLLADISQNVVVILSTHIVDDVAQLCSDMAIISRGVIVRHGAPNALIAELKGKVWRAFITKAELDGAKAAHNVILSRLVGGRTLIHVLSDTNPGQGFEPVVPDLEDVYFTALTAAQKA
jgi:ABC-type multidrug transport system ATPase subunit